MRTKKTSLRRKLLIYFLFLSLVPMVIVGSIAFLITKRQLERSTQAHLSDLARNCGWEISYYIGEVYQDIKRIRESDIVSRDSEAIQKLTIDLREAHYYYDAISVIDLKGTIIASTREELIGQSRADRTWFQKTLQSRNIVPIDAYLAESAVGTVVFGLNASIVDEKSSEVIGVIAAKVKMDHIAERVRILDARTLPGNHAYLLNRSGEILAGPDEMDFLKRYRLYDFPVVQDLLAGKTGITRYKNDRNEDVISARYALVGDGDFDGWGWGIIVTEPVSVTFRAAYLIRNIMIAVVVVIALLAAVFSIIISKRFSRPIIEVSDSALRIADGDLKVTEIRYDSPDEIGDLVAAFNKMSADLQTTTVSRDLLANEITERKRAETALRESEGKFRILSEQSQLGIAIIQNGLFKYTNIAFSEIVDCSVEEILLWKTGDFTRLTDSALSLEQGQEGISRKIQINTRGGEVKWIEFFAKNIRYSGRKAEMITIIDITGKKRAEEKARQQQQQLIELDRLASLGALVAGVAHEINNPNQTIMSNANRIIETWKSIVPILEEYYEENGDFLAGGLNYSRMRKQMPVYQRGIAEGAKSIGLIVSDLKNFARQENYERHEEININRVVNSSVTLASDYIKKATKRFSFEIEENLPMIKGNFQRLEQVMINLIQNACQALQNNEQGILITTSFAAGRDCVEVKVRDEGAGIAPDNLTRIKDPFFTTKRVDGGMGLGLSISATIIEDHQGSLTIASERGKGTTASICLPVIPGESGSRTKQDP
ncbi:MAG TPA: HAMP domain-containing protein [bacterium]|nr:HAMP domain-containing protein [bacterium]